MLNPVSDDEIIEITEEEFMTMGIKMVNLGTADHVPIPLAKIV
jgi:hypothetical protein